MSGKQSKKERQIQRRIFREEYSEKVRLLSDAHSRFLKPKPKWVPARVWLKLLGIFVYLKK